MDVHIEVWLDGVAEVRAVRAAEWFRACTDRLFPGHAQEAGAWNAALARGEDDGLEWFVGGASRRGEFLDALTQPHYWAQWAFGEDEEEGRVRSSSAYLGGEFAVLSAALSGGDRGVSDRGFCTGLVECVVDAVGEADPAFGRIEWGQFSDRANLDIALRRKPRVFLPAAREELRGYAWLTVCPKELLDRLGGWRELAASGSFHRVIPLPAGGAVLQASKTLAGYSDAVMEGVFMALAPVLPAGLPSDHHAFPGVRFVPRDARGSGSGHHG